MIALRTVLERIAADEKNLRDLGVKSLSVFGSVARREASDDSDIDMLVEFDRPVGFLALGRLQLHLEQLLGAPVDLVTPGGIRSSMRERILREAIRAA